MFESTLSSSSSLGDAGSRRGLATLTSFTVQALFVAALLTLPLLRPAGIPLLRQLSTPLTLSGPEQELVHARSGPNATNVVNAMRDRAQKDHAEILLRQPAQIPHQIVTASADDAAPPVGGAGPYIPGLKGTSAGVPGSLESNAPPVIPAAPVRARQVVRLSRISEGDLLRRVLPTYPPLARSARIQGTVVLQAMISKSGTIENLRLLSGHPMLAPAAIEAVKQWRYRPYILNNEPVAVETQITVNFSLETNP